MNIEIKEDGTVLRDGKNIGTYADGEYHPAEGVAHNTAAAVAKRIEDLDQSPLESRPDLVDPEENQRAYEKSLNVADPIKDKPAPAKGAREPNRDPRLGDKTPEWAAWCKRHKPARFKELDERMRGALTKIVGGAE